MPGAQIGTEFNKYEKGIEKELFIIRWIRTFLNARDKGGSPMNMTNEHACNHSRRQRRQTNGVKRHKVKVWLQN